MRRNMLETVSSPRRIAILHARPLSAPSTSRTSTVCLWPMMSLDGWRLQAPGLDRRAACEGGFDHGEFEVGVTVALGVCPSGKTADQRR
jgi:hypothetical protein